MEKIQVTILEGLNEVTVREGKALELHHPKAVVIEGNIDTPVEFARKRWDLLKSKADNSYLVVDMPKKTIILTVDEKNPHDYYQITGVLKYSDNLRALGINSGNKLSRTDLINLLKKNKYYFPDKDEYSKILSSVEKFSVKIQKEIEQNADNKGNSNNLLKYSSNWGEGLSNSFKISVPIFEGQPNTTMMVEIGLDPTDAAVRFYLESEDLYELIAEKTETTIGETILWFETETTLPIIFK